VPRLGLVGLAQAAIELEDVGNVLGDLVAVPSQRMMMFFMAIEPLRFADNSIF
jgi:hypothetical protein